MSQAKPRVAVVVTCHNDGNLLPAAIESIKSQGERSELVIVDDGSSDQPTLRALEQLESSGSRVLRQANQGQSAATMTGLHATSAPYVMRFDADDVLLPGAIESLGHALDRCPGAAAAWGDVETFGLTTFHIPSAPKLDPWLVTYTNCIPGSGTLYRRTAVADAGGWQLKGGFEDWDLWMSLAELGYSGVYVNQPIFRYHRDGRGQLALWLPKTTAHYEELRARHAQLFGERNSNLRRSEAPFILKKILPLVDRLGWLPRLLRIQLCELFTHILWNGGVRMTSLMVKQAVAIRLGFR